MIDTFKQNFVNKDVYNQLLRLQVPEDETMWVDMGMCFVQIIIIPFILFICLILFNYCNISICMRYALHFSHESESHSDVSSPRHSAGSTPKGTIAVCLEEQTTKTVPLDEKEGRAIKQCIHAEWIKRYCRIAGWCRNKKYIEKVAAGFMCTVCRKIYGRYNSVSYHVTIYHRNPPIK